MHSRTVRLPPEAVSVSAARRHVREVLTLAGHEDWADDAQLAVSELVTNVVLHARTDCEVSVLVGPHRVRVAVRDFSPVVPLERHFSDHSTTGRGLRLVARLGADFGVESLSAGGKAVWFTLDGSAPAALEGADAEWDLDGLDLLEEIDRIIVLPAVPLVLWSAALEHHAAVLRELFLVRAARPDDVGSVDLAVAGQALTLLLSATERAVRTLPRSGPDSAAVDVTLALAGTDTEMFGRFQDALDLGRDLARHGRLLLRPPLPEIVSLRDWACDQAVAQVKGVPPKAWDSSQVGTGDTLPWAGAALNWDDALVRFSDRAVVAADDSNRIFAVSKAAAELLGYDVGELVGQRITTIIPLRLREAHVAGFTRHLTTGQVSVLGRRLHVPVLHRDGSEVVHGLLLEARPTGTGRQVYLGWLEP